MKFIFTALLIFTLSGCGHIRYVSVSASTSRVDCRYERCNYDRNDRDCGRRDRDCDDDRRGKNKHKH
jgi:uncharacterized protein YceK